MQAFNSDLAHPISRPTREDWLELSKSRIVFLVLVTTFFGYALGVSPESPWDMTRFFVTLLGTGLLAAGSSALNQLQEAQVDATMPRTARRPIPSGRIEPTLAASAAFVLIASGAGVLLMGAPPSVVGLGILTVVLYNGFYTLWWKRQFSRAAVPGAIPGALPILMGYAGASGQWLDPTGIYLFLVLFFWQMPHFWVLALRYREDYSKGGFPTLPVAKGVDRTVTEIVVWCLAYCALSLLAPFFIPHAGGWSIAAASAMSLVLLIQLWRFTRAPESSGAWLRFFLSVNFSLLVFLIAFALDAWRMPLFRAVYLWWSSS
jgi:protoheme IX farnesyltransferase